MFHRAIGTVLEGFEQALAYEELISAGAEAVSLCHTPSPLAEDFRAVDGKGRGLSLFFQR